MDAATSPMLDAALQYHCYGWGVIPVTQDKRPLTQWAMWRYGGQTEQAVRELFSRPADGLALMTWPASPLAVIDLDGIHAPSAWKEVGLPLPETAHTWTRNDGEHRIFRMPDPLLNGGRAVADQFQRKVRLVAAQNCDCTKRCGVDLLLNGYFIVPPTPGYREDPDHTLEPATIAVLPEQVLTLARRASPSLQGSDTHTNGASVPGSDEDWFVAAWRGVPEGQRNETATRLAGYWLRVTQGSEEATLRAMEAWAERCMPPMDLKELRTTIGSVARREAAQKDAGAVVALPVLPARDFLAKDFAARGSIISGGNLPTGGKLVIVGPGGVGKSILALDMGVSLARGRAVIDEFPVTAAQRVGVFLCEDPAGETQTRSNRQLHGQEPPEGLFLFTREEPLLLAGPRGKPNEATLGRLVETVKQHRLSVVIFDPLVALHESDENSNSEMARWLYRLSAVLEPVSCAIILTHHVTWGLDGETHSRGATAIQNWADTVWHMRPITPGGREAVKLTIAKINFGPRWAPLVLSLDQETLLFRAESEQGALCPVPALLDWFRDEHGGAFRGKKGDVYQQVQERFGCGLRTAREAFRLALAHQPPLLKDLGRGSGFEVIA